MVNYLVGERFMKPFRSMFPRLENHSTVDPSEELAENTRGLVGSTVDYMVCLLSDIFMPTYDGPNNFAKIISLDTVSTMASGLQSDLTGRLLPQSLLIVKRAEQLALTKLLSV